MVSHAGLEFVPLARRALWLPDQNILFVADLHLGKGAVFREAGLPVPAGTTAETLRNLRDLVIAHSTKTLVVLGDFLHDARRPDPGLENAVRECLDLPGLGKILIPGNHDRSLPSTGEYWSFTVMQPGSTLAGLGGLRLFHHPPGVKDAPWIAGHIHPVVVLKGRGRQRLKLPAVVHSGNGWILPAFGEFTGGGRWPMGKMDRAFLCTGAEGPAKEARIPAGRPGRG